MSIYISKNFYPRLKKSVIAILVLIFAGFGSQAAAQISTIKQGEVSLYPISSTEGQSALLGGEKIPVFNYNGQNYALVTADVNKKLGNYYLRIKIEDKELENRIIKVVSGNYKQIVRKVAYQFATLPKEKQEAVTIAKAPLSASLKKAAIGSSTIFSNSAFINPLQSITTTSPFGSKRVYTNYATTHRGVDLKADIGTPVYAISDADVLWGEVKPLYLEGPTVILDHGEGIVSEYLHLSKVIVQTGSRVHVGDVVGYSGAEGADVTGPHLHFSIKVRNAAVNPLQFISEFQKVNKN